MILSQLWRGLADVPAGRTWGPGELAAGLSCAVDRAYEAVGDPVEGTILTVARAAAAGASRGSAPARSRGGRRRWTRPGRHCPRPPASSRRLHAAGVVDAGGRGLVVVLEALLCAVRGDERARSRPGALVTAAAGAPAAAAAPDPRTAIAHRRAIPVRLRGPVPARGRRGRGRPAAAELGALGDSVAVADGGDGHWNVHVHVDDVGAAIEAGVRAGRPHRIEVTRFADQLTDQVPERSRARHPAARRDHRRRGTRARFGRAVPRRRCGRAPGRRRRATRTRTRCSPPFGPAGPGR